MGILLWIILDLILGLISIITWIGIEGEETLKYFLSSSFFLLTFLLLLWGRKKLKYLVKSNTFKNYTRELITIILTIFIIFLFSFLGVKYNYQKDITGIKLHSLSQQTINILKLFPHELDITFFSEKKNWRLYEEHLQKYKNLNKNFNYKFVDPNKEPALLLKYGLTHDGSALIKYEGAEIAGLANSELNLTNLLIKLSRKEEFTLCYDSSHEELDFKNKEGNGLSFFHEKLAESLYVLKEIKLLELNSVPRACSLLFILGARTPFIKKELSSLDKYMEEGGNLFITLAPVFGENKLKSFFDFISEHGINAANSIVVDRLASVQGSSATIPVITSFNQEHQITKKFEGRVFFPLTLSLFSSSKENFRYTTLAKTSAFPASWGKRDLNTVGNEGKVFFDEKIDLKGPIDVLSASENLDNFSRLIVFGSSSVFINASSGNASNFNLSLNAVSWLLGDTGLVSLNRPTLSQDRIFVSLGEKKIIMFSLFFIPLFFFSLSFFFYRRRNH